MRYQIKFTNAFKRDIKLAEKQNKNIALLMNIIERLANGEVLENKYQDHNLTGEYRGARECHIGPDWLLIYEIIENSSTLMLYRLGSHSDLFK